MKTQTSILLVLFFIFISSCTPSESNTFTDEDKANIEKELRQINEMITESVDNLNTDYFKKAYLNTDQFLAVDSNGIYSYYHYIEDLEYMYADMKMLQFEKDTTIVRIFDNHTAILMNKGNAFGENKEGVKMKLNELNVSMLFRKVEEDWKVSYIHESATLEIMKPKDSVADISVVKM